MALYFWPRELGLGWLTDVGMKRAVRPQRRRLEPFGMLA